MLLAVVPWLQRIALDPTMKQSLADPHCIMLGFAPVVRGSG